MSSTQPIPQIGRFKTFIRERVSPRLTNFYGRFGFANRAALATTLKTLPLSPEFHDRVLDILASRGILKGRFRSEIKTLDHIESFMLHGATTHRQIEQAEEGIDTIRTIADLGSTTPVNAQLTIETIGNALGTAAAARATMRTIQGSLTTPDMFFQEVTLDVANSLDRIFPGADGTHSKLAHGIGSAMGFYTIGEKSGGARIGFMAAISLGIIATAASPFLFTAIGSFLCTAGFQYAGWLKAVGGGMAAIGYFSKWAKKHSLDQPDSKLAWVGRQKWMQNLLPAGMSLFYLGFTFGASVKTTFVLGDFLLNHGNLLGGLTIGIPLSSIIGSLVYYHIGTRRAILANGGIPAPYGEEDVRTRDIKKTYAYSGTAVVFSTMYFFYRWMATSFFVSCAFNTLTMGSVAATMGLSLFGFVGSHAATMKAGKFRSPFPGFINGAIGSVALPLIYGAIAGDIGCFSQVLSSVLSLGVFSADVHSFTHGVMFHQGQIGSLFPDRLAPSVSMDEKKAYAGYYGRRNIPGKKPITAFWEKAFVTPPDIVFSVLTSALFEPYAYLKQCVLQCDAANRGKGAAAKNSLNSIRIAEQSQEALNEVYALCSASLQRIRSRSGNPVELQENYRDAIGLLCQIGIYFGKNIPARIKQMRDEIKEDWKGIYDQSIDISLKKSAEFFAWAKDLECRLNRGDELSQEEVENVVLYLCDRFDKEFIIGFRKDSNEYSMRIQKNENQSGTREFIGSSGYEIVRFNPKTKLASIERLHATHVRRQNMEWDHADPSDKYTWHHRTASALDSDPIAVREYREKVKSHSKDLAFVINDPHGTPLALQTQEGEILLIAPSDIERGVLFGNTLNLRLADGTAVALTREDYRIGSKNVTFADGTPARLRVTSVQEYNQQHENKIYRVANQADPKNPIIIEELPVEAHEYYTKRPLFTYSVDPHDYEFNLDSEFVNGRIGLEYVPLFERDRQNKYVSIAYRTQRHVSLDYSPSGIPQDRKPDQIQLNWAPMYMRVRTKDGLEYCIPYLEEKNGQVEPTITVEKPAVNRWETVLEQYAPYFQPDPKKSKFNDDTFIAIFEHELLTEDGVGEIKLHLPAALFMVGDKKIAPTSPEEFAKMVEEYRTNNPEATVSAKHERKYNWRRIKRTEIDQKEKKIYFVYDTDNNLEARSTVPSHSMVHPHFSMHLPPIAEIESIQTEVFTQSVGTLPYGRYIYRFDNVAEAEHVGHSRIQRNEDGGLILNQNGQPVMESGCPIWIERDDEGQIVSYAIERFGRPNSIFKLGALDPSSIAPGSLRIVDGQLTFEAVEWNTKLYPIDSKMVDLGSEENPAFTITGVVTQKKDLETQFGKGTVVWCRNNNPDGSENYALVPVGRKLSRTLDILKAEAIPTENGVSLQITRKQGKYADLLISNTDFYCDGRSCLRYSPEWVEKVKFGELAADGREIILTYRNPHTGQTLPEVQTIRSRDPRLVNIDNFCDPKMELREIYDRSGNVSLVPQLKVTRIEIETIDLGAGTEALALLGEGNDLTVIDPKSALSLSKTNPDGSVVTLVVPLRDKIDGEAYVFEQSRATPEEKIKQHHHLPHFEDGKVGLIIGPQLSISGRNWFDYSVSGHPYCALDQSIFMGYDLNFGYNYGRRPYADGVGGGNIQAHKSRAGDGRTRETTTVQNGTPVGRPLRKTLASGDTWNEAEARVPFFSFAPMPATITEDYREGKGIYKKHGHAAIFHNKVVAIGAGVPEFPTQIVIQRRRWPSSVPIGQYWFFRDLWDELVEAKIKGKAPSFYTWNQLLHEWNGVTWYYCGIAENVRTYATLAYYLGLTAYPVDAISFPLVWAGSFASSMASHVYSMAKVGNHWRESIYWGQAAYKTLQPNYAEMVTPQPDLTQTEGGRLFEEIIMPRLAKECLGQFGVTAMAGGGKLPPRYLDSIDMNIAMKGTAFLRGLMEMQHYSQAVSLTGKLAPEGFDQFTTYFAIFMNTIWPFYDTVLNLGARKLATNDRDKDVSIHNRRRARLMAEMLLGTGKASDMQNILGITDAPRDLEDRARYFQDLHGEELRELFLEMPDRAVPDFLWPMLEERTVIRAGHPVSERYLHPVKIASMLESMIFSADDSAAFTKTVYLHSVADESDQRPLAEKLTSAQAAARAKAIISAGLAAHLLDGIRQRDPAVAQAILDLMQEPKRDRLNAIIG